jgi:hypothetical protein
MGSEVIEVVDYFNATPGQDTDILTTAYRSKQEVSAFRISFSPVAASKLYVMVDVPGGSSPIKIELNGGAQVAAGTMYEESFGIRRTRTYNFQVETAGKVNYLTVEEVTRGVL